MILRSIGTPYSTIGVVFFITPGPWSCFLRGLPSPTLLYRTIGGTLFGREHYQPEALATASLAGASGWFCNSLQTGAQSFGALTAGWWPWAAVPTASPARR